MERRRHRAVACVVALSLPIISAPAVVRASIRMTRPGAPIPRWVVRSDGGDHLTDSPAGVVVTDGGATVVVGATSETVETKRDISAVAIDAATGATRWTADFDGTAHRNDHAVGIAATPDGSTVFVLGTTVSADTRADYVTLAFDAATGALRWSTLLDGGTGEGDVAASIAVSPDGSTVFVTGTSRRGEGRLMTTAAYSAFSGSPLWKRDEAGLEPTEIPIEEGVALTVSPDGRAVYVVGQGYIPGVEIESGRSFDVIAYRSSDGLAIWKARPVGWNCSYPYPRSIAVSPDGRTVAVTGRQDTGCNSSFLGFATAAVDADTGDTRWMKSSTGDYWGSTYGATAVTFTPDSQRVIQTGNLLSTHMATVAYAPDTGKRAWTARYNGGGFDLALAVGSTPDSGMVVVTGLSTAPTHDDDYATIGYRASDGTTSWVARWDDGSHGNDVAVALAMAPDGSAVYVTGWAYGSSTGADVVTIAYPIG